MRVVPGTHQREVVAHKDTFGEHNMLSRGQEIAVEVDEDHAVDLVLAAGPDVAAPRADVPRLEPNRADHRRIGFAIRYIAATCPTAVGADSATLVRGKDRFGNFEPEPAPAPTSTRAVAFHRSVRERRMAILMRDAAQASTAGHAAPAM